MLSYIILAAIWAFIIFGWLMPVIRERVFYEIYAAVGVGGYFTLLILGLSGRFAKFDILPLKVIGLALYIPAAFFIIGAFIGLHTKGKPTDSWEHTTLIIRSGVFRIVRHPLYFGTAIWTVALMLVFQSIPSAILGIVCIICLWTASRKEDDFNLQKFGDEYRGYMDEIPMWNLLRHLRGVGQKKSY